MAPYKALYSRKCKSLVCWNEVGEGLLAGLELVRVTSEKLPIIQEWLRIAPSQYWSYVDPKRKDMVFMVGDYAFLKVSPMKGVMKFVAISEDLSYEETLVSIMDVQVRKLRSKEIPMFKVLSCSHAVEEYISDEELKECLKGYDDLEELTIRSRRTDYTSFMTQLLGSMPLDRETIAQAHCS
eukprot:XP_015572683.1 uncharacterized protein LOC107260972 [Ricinus communis]